MNIRKGLISIVVPVYNVEKYLNRCVESLVNQTYKNLEIILIDDGSTDCCSRLCNEWAERDKRIKVVHKENAGLGMARNTGIENASGEYIYFLDSDDYIAYDAMEKCYRLAVREGADMVSFGLFEVRKDGSIDSKTVPTPEKYVFHGSEVQEKFLPDLIGPDFNVGRSSNLWMSACGSFCRLEVIQKAKWRFVSERIIISEDYFSLLRLYQNIGSVAVLPEALYFYCENLSSLTHIYREDRFEKIKYFYNSAIQECDKIGYSDVVKERLAYLYLSNTISALKQIAIANCGGVEKRQRMNQIIKDQDLRNTLAKTNLKKEKVQRKLLFFSIQYRLFFVCRLLIYAKVKKR